MSRVRKNEFEAILLGQELRSRRNEKGITLIQVSEGIQVSAGQLSRFEQGEFKFVTFNLQKFANFLQIDISKVQDQLSLENRFETARKRSERHEAVAAAFVMALERLK